MKEDKLIILLYLLLFICTVCNALSVFFLYGIYYKIDSIFRVLIEVF